MTKYEEDPPLEIKGIEEIINNSGVGSDGFDFLFNKGPSQNDGYGQMGLPSTQNTTINQPNIGGLVTDSPDFDFSDFESPTNKTDNLKGRSDMFAGMNLKPASNINQNSNIGLNIGQGLAGFQPPPKKSEKMKNLKNNSYQTENSNFGITNNMNSGINSNTNNNFMNLNTNNRICIFK